MQEADILRAVTKTRLQTTKIKMLLYIYLLQSSIQDKTGAQICMNCANHTVLCQGLPQIHSNNAQGYSCPKLATAGSKDEL